MHRLSAGPLPLPPEGDSRIQPLGGESSPIYSINRCIRRASGYIELALANQSLSRLGRSSVELVFSDDLKPESRERSMKNGGSKLENHYEHKTIRGESFL